MLRWSLLSPFFLFRRVMYFDTFSLVFHFSQKSYVHFSQLLTSAQFSSFHPLPSPHFQLLSIYFKKVSLLYMLPSYLPCSFYELEKAPHLGWQVTHLCQGNKQNLPSTLMWNVYNRYSSWWVLCLENVDWENETSSETTWEGEHRFAIYLSKLGREEQKVNMGSWGTRKPRMKCASGGWFG